MTTIHPAFKEDNVAVITGAASGIGLAAARKFASFGMSVVLVDLDGEKLAAAHADILNVAKDGEAQIVTIPTDVSKLDELEALERAVIQRFGRIHVLMNNAGIQPGSAIFGPQANWEKVINVNLMGVVNGSRVFGQGMVAMARRRSSSIPARSRASPRRPGIPPITSPNRVSKPSRRHFSTNCAIFPTARFLPTC